MRRRDLLASMAAATSGLIGDAGPSRAALPADAAAGIPAGVPVGHRDLVVSGRRPR